MPAGVQGILRRGGRFSPVPPDPVSILEARIAARRYEVETAGVLIGDVALATDRTAQGQLANVAVAAFMDEGFRCRWKTRDGFVELSSSQILEVARAVQKHIEACFDREAELLDYLASGLYEEVMFDQGWPTSTLSQTASE